jgi:hypothetical protein
LSDNAVTKIKQLTEKPEGVKVVGGGTPGPAVTGKEIDSAKAVMHQTLESGQRTERKQKRWNESD